MALSEAIATDWGQWFAESQIDTRSSRFCRNSTTLPFGDGLFARQKLVSSYIMASVPAAVTRSQARGHLRRLGLALHPRRAAVDLGGLRHQWTGNLTCLQRSG